MDCLVDSPTLWYRLNRAMTGITGPVNVVGGMLGILIIVGQWKTELRCDVAQIEGVGLMGYRMLSAYSIEPERHVSCYVLCVTNYARLKILSHTVLQLQDASSIRTCYVESPITKYFWKK